ncbi:copper chaperone PCu(A)C [Streptomyces sp. NA04227]|uniref:copper chaperone PCu(A)C n=1 Tax=Streptomyces sp. NA04227 TaxID=2742136 RepID=UPI0020CA8203|nr:copper chaperone PCu(A)C [Streptomyces sp. NA04227]
MSLQPSLRRGALAATAVAFSVAALGACAAGNNAPTLEIKPDNAYAQVEDIKVQNALVITQPHHDVKGPTAVSATLFNNGDTDQVLQSVTVDGQKAELKAAKGKALEKGGLVVPAHGSIVLGGKNNAVATLATLPKGLTLGDVAPTAFTFSKTGDVKLDSFVVPADGSFTEWGPEVVPAPSESGKPSDAPGDHQASPSAPAGDDHAGDEHGGGEQGGEAGHEGGEEGHEGGEVAPGESAPNGH